MYLSNSKPWRILKEDIRLFWEFYPRTVFDLLYNRVMGKKRRPSAYAGRRVQTVEEGNECLKQKILSGESFFAGRIGSNELLMMRLAHFSSRGYNKEENWESYWLNCENCGLFPVEKQTIIRFGDLMMESLKHCDFLFVWYNILEDYFTRKHTAPDTLLTHRKVMDFWNFEQPWTQALANKRVLVIHPLDDLIQQQYEKREMLFHGTNVLPQFELRTLRAIQTIAGCTDYRFPTWFDALEYMYEEALKIDFDVALIGCGAYGFPLAAKLRQAGKQVIHMGGVTQILFGIRGQRWDRDGEPLLMRYINNAWVRPGQGDVPQKGDQVEGNCYW